MSARKPKEWILECGTRVVEAEAYYELRRMIKVVADENKALNKIANKASNVPRPRDAQPRLTSKQKSQLLTPAQLEVAVSIIQGLSTKEIAAQQGSTDSAVKYLTTEIYKKCGLGGSRRASLMKGYYLDELPAGILNQLNIAVAAAEPREGLPSGRKL